RRLTVVSRTGKRGRHGDHCRGAVTLAGAMEQPLGASLTLLSAFELTWDGAIRDCCRCRRSAFGLRCVAGSTGAAHLRGSETLWLESSEAQARGSLRSALWRLRRPGCERPHLGLSGPKRLQPTSANGFRLTRT